MVEGGSGGGSLRRRAPRGRSGQGVGDLRGAVGGSVSGWTTARGPQSHPLSGRPDDRRSDKNQSRSPTRSGSDPSLHMSTDGTSEYHPRCRASYPDAEARAPRDAVRGNRQNKDFFSLPVSPPQKSFRFPCH